MRNRILCALLLLAPLSVTCFGQTTYEGITPGRSTRADVVRAWGQPFRNVSATLSEYHAPKTGDIPSVYVQYADPSRAARVERIELVCEVDISHSNTSARSRCEAFVQSLWGNHQLRGEAAVRTDPSSNIIYNAAPDLIVETYIDRAAQSSHQYRVGLYSRELYESALPQPCTGKSFIGTWETTRGRVTLTPTGPQDSPTDADYVNTEAGALPQLRLWGGDIAGRFNGHWAEGDNRGTFTLQLSSQAPNTFTGTWVRTEGTGPRSGKWEGRCVAVEGGRND